MTQQSLFPIKVKQLIPNPGTSADIRYFAIGEDGHEYAAKEVLPGNPSLPAAEYLGYCMAATCSVAVPTTAELKMPDGSIALGSRFEGGVDGCSDLMPADQIAALTQCATELTALLSLDVFLANNDRHGGNFLHRKGKLSGLWAMIAIDFSRAMWVSGFPATPPIVTAQNGHTSTTITIIKRLGLWDNARKALTAASLSAISNQKYSEWINSMPPSWLNQDVIDSIAWWASADRPQRIQDVINSI